MKTKVESLRIRLTQYRNAEIANVVGRDVSVHVNAIDIALSLVEYAIHLKRPIRVEEEGWFKAGLSLAYIFENSEWEDLYLKYKDLCATVINLNYFRDSTLQSQ